MKKAAVLLTLGGIAALIVAACGGADPTATPVPTSTPLPTATPAPTAPPAPSVTPAPTATPRPVPTPTRTPIPPTSTPVKEQIKRGGTIRFYLPADLQTLDPTKIFAYTIWFSLDPIWSNLIKYKSEFWEQNEIVGDLADSWEVNDSGDVYTFKINPDARFQNVAPVNGRRLTAADVKWTFDLFRDEEYGSAFASRMALVKDVEAPDDNTVRLTLIKPANNLLPELAHVTTKIHAKELLDSDLFGEREGVIGSGAFMFEKWDTGSIVRAVRNPTYWKQGDDDKALPYVDAYEVIIIGDAQSHIANIRSGNIAFAGITGLTAALAGPLEGVAGIQRFPVHPMFIYCICFQSKSDPATNKTLRKALLKAVDLSVIMENANKAPEAPLESFVHSTNPNSLPQARLKELTKPDLDEAKRLLVEAGFADGLKVDMLVNNNSPPQNLQAAIVKQQWEAIGVEAEIVTGPPSLTYPKWYAGDWTTGVMPMGLTQDPIDMLKTDWLGGARAFYGYENAEVSAIVDKAQAEFDPTKLKQLLAQAQEIMWADAPGLPLSPGLRFQVQWEWLKGFQSNWSWGNMSLEFAWIDK